MAETGENLRRRSSRLASRVDNAREGVKTRRSIRDSYEESADERTKELENQLESIEEDRHKPTELYVEEQDVSGASMYTFSTPSKSGAMAQKLATIRLSVTPKKQEHVAVTAETPRSTRRTKKSVVVSLDNISEMMSTESESGSEEDENKTSISQTRLKRSTRVNYNDYHLKTDEYFETQSEKVLTSNRTLERLVNPELDKEKLQLLLNKQSHVSKEHKKAIKSLSQDYRTLYPMWLYIIEEGYSLLLHGLGSKRSLINDFREKMLSDHPTLVVHGFFPGLTIKEILDGIIVDLLGLDSPTNPNECLKLIESTLKDNPEDRLYLLVHNIDGLSLRSNKVQDALSFLANIPNLSLIASIDHINAPLIWDSAKHSCYNFCWWDVTTLLPYTAETSFEGSIMVQKSGALALSSLINVFLSLTTNAREIYLLLVKHQLEHANNNTYLGMAFKDLYSSAREAFLVSSDLALRAQLTEFTDHKLVRSKRNYDGAEYLQIPLDNALLKQFLEQQKNA